MMSVNDSVSEVARRPSRRPSRGRSGRPAPPCRPPRPARSRSAARRRCAPGGTPRRSAGCRCAVSSALVGIVGIGRRANRNDSIGISGLSASRTVTVTAATPAGRLRETITTAALTDPAIEATAAPRKPGTPSAIAITPMVATSPGRRRPRACSARRTPNGPPAARRRQEPGEEAVRQGRVADQGPRGESPTARDSAAPATIRSASTPASTADDRPRRSRQRQGHRPGDEEHEPRPPRPPGGCACHPFPGTFGDARGDHVGHVVEHGRGQHGLTRPEVEHLTVEHAQAPQALADVERSAAEPLEHPSGRRRRSPPASPTARSRLGQHVGQGMSAGSARSAFCAEPRS